ncbi:MAG: hypothetical protein GF393_06065, partial [Armatimonadia bacterium]|nr:hypothetical protein [Armatimonadia bacterium]
RIVFRRAGSQDGLFVSDLFGGNEQRISSDSDFDPNWSPGGNLIATSNGFGSNAEIILLDEDGSNRRNLTSNSDGDYDPAFSPDGYMIAYYRSAGADREIYLTSLDGDSHTNLTDNALEDTSPEWTPDGHILFTRDFDRIMRMADDGTGETFLTDPPASEADDDPQMSPDGSTLAFTREGTDDDIHIADADGSHVRKITQSSDDQSHPAFSTCGRFVAYSRQEGSNDQIYVQELAPPHRVHAVVTSGEDDVQPDLGSPTVQTSRVLIGGSGTDRGYDPVHAHGIAAVVSFNEDGYLNFIRLGIPPDRLNSLNVTPLEGTGQNLVGVVWSAIEMYYVEQDEGAGAPTTLWDLSGQTSRSIALYLDANTGRLVSILDLDDDVTTASTGAALVHEQNGAATTVRGDVRAVYGPDGELVADGEIGSVEIDAAQGVVRAY